MVEDRLEVDVLGPEIREQVFVQDRSVGGIARCCPTSPLAALDGIQERLVGLEDLLERRRVPLEELPRELSLGSDRVENCLFPWPHDAVPVEGQVEGLGTGVREVLEEFRQELVLAVLVQGLEECQVLGEGTRKVVHHVVRGVVLARGGRQVLAEDLAHPIGVLFCRALGVPEPGVFVAKVGAGRDEGGGGDIVEDVVDGAGGGGKGTAHGILAQADRGDW